MTYVFLFVSVLVGVLLTGCLYLVYFAIVAVQILFLESLSTCLMSSSLRLPMAGGVNVHHTVQRLINYI